jgi:opacity protein-like surface antigen
MALKRRYSCVAMLTALSGALYLVPVRAQVAAAGSEPGRSLWVGGDYTNFSASFPFQSGRRLEGTGLFVDYHVDNWLWLEGEANLLSFSGFDGSTESSFLGGPKIYFLTNGNLRLYGKLLAGAGSIFYPLATGHATRPALTPGAGADYRVSRRWAVRMGYEYQIWFDAPGYAAGPGERLTPNGFHAGVAYNVF